jgi:hypothetical protein
MRSGFDGADFWTGLPDLFRFILKPKILVNFGGPWDEKVGIVYGHLE